MALTAVQQLSVAAVVSVCQAIPKSCISAGHGIVRLTLNRYGLPRGGTAPDSLRQAPTTERMLVEAITVVFRLGLDVGYAKQSDGLHGLWTKLLKLWRQSPIGSAAMVSWDGCAAARARMFAVTHSNATGLWSGANDRRGTRLNAFDFERIS